MQGLLAIVQNSTANNNANLSENTSNGAGASDMDEDEEMDTDRKFSASAASLLDVCALSPQSASPKEERQFKQEEGVNGNGNGCLLDDLESGKDLELIGKMLNFLVSLKSIDFVN